jgi:hypothetical protein
MEFELIKKDLQMSGSLAARDRVGVTFQAAIDNNKEGYIYAATKKRVYNIDELKKAIDVNITELIPESQAAELDLIPRPLYNEVTQSLNEALVLIDEQSTTISNLEADVSILLAVSASLDVKLDGERLLRVTAEANSEQLRKQFTLVNDSYQVSLERTVLEGIERVSLQSRNEGQGSTIQSLQKQVDSLTQQLMGKNARIAEGAKVGGELTVRVIEKGDPNQKDIYFDYKNRSAAGVFLSGPSLELFNSSLERMNIDITFDSKGDLVWLKNAKTTLEPQEKKVIKLEPNYPGFNWKREKGANHQGIISIKSGTNEVTLTANMWRHKT